MTYLTTAELADLFRTSPESVRYWRTMGTGPKSIKVGKRILYDREEVERWAASKADADPAEEYRAPEPRNMASSAERAPGPRPTVRSPRSSAV